MKKKKGKNLYTMTVVTVVILVIFAFVYSKLNINQSLTPESNNNQQQNYTRPVNTTSFGDGLSTALVVLHTDWETEDFDNTVLYLGNGYVFAQLTSKNKSIKEGYVLAKIQANDKYEIIFDPTSKNYCKLDSDAYPVTLKNWCK
jgi:hypothetical protein